MPTLPNLPTPGPWLVAGLAACLAICSASDPAAASVEPDPNIDGQRSDRAIAADPRFHLDVEIDPTAFLFRGYSLHVGLGWRRVRLDLGAFAMAMPKAIETNDAFDTSFNGYGVKLQYFPFGEQRGGFAGVNAGRSWQLTQLAGADLASRHAHVDLGVNAGWRFALGARFHVTAWLSVSRVFGGRDVVLADQTYDARRITIFPAIHLGYRFQ